LSRYELWRGRISELFHTYTRYIDQILLIFHITVVLRIRAVHFKHFRSKTELQGFPQVFHQVSLITVLHSFDGVPIIRYYA